MVSASPRVTLLDRLVADVARPDIVRGVTATVTAVGTGTVTVTVSGNTVAGVPTANSYTSPAVNDVVLILKIGSAWLALTAL